MAACYSTELVAQKRVSDANITGHVIDAKTGEHLPGMTIAIKGTTFGTATDNTGHFALRHLKPGKLTLVMRGLGYISQEREVNIEANKTREVNFEAQEDQIRIDEVVVSANRQATLRRLAPALVNVVDSKTFEAANANNLAQGLIFQPGVRIENNCQNCGFNQVRINGLDGRYSQILIDSRPIMSALAGVYGLEQIPTNMIDRVEVVRGGGSALYGSSAIAGVVNIITKEPTRNSVSFSESLGFTGFKSLDNNLGFNASVVTDDGRAGAMLFGQSRYRKEHDINGDGYSELGRIDGRALGFRAYVRPSQMTKLTAEIHSFSEDRRGGDHLDWPDHVAGVSESTNHSVYSGNLKYDLFSRDYKKHLQVYGSAQYVNRKSYYGGIGETEAKDKDGNVIRLPNGETVKAGRVGYPIHASDFGINNGLSKGFTWVLGTQYTHDFERLLFMPAQLLVGVEYMHDHLNDQMPLRHWYTDAYNAGGLGGTTTSPIIDQKIGNFSQFAQIEWKNEHWSLLLGTRLDEHSAVKGAILSPRATLRYNPSRNINLRATYAKGFRAPQVFDEDLHVGVVSGQAQRIFNAEGLKPEISHAFSVSSDMYFNIGETSLNVLAEGFYTRLKDVFTNNLVNANDHGIKVYERNNYGKDSEGNIVSSGAKILGMNLEAKLAYRWLQLQAGLTLTSNKYDAEQEWGVRNAVGAIPGEDQAAYLAFVPKQDGSDFVTERNADDETQNISMTSRDILRTPSLYGYFTIGINPIKPLNISLTGTYTGSMYVPHAIVWGQGAAVSDRRAIASGLRQEGFSYVLTKAGVAVADAEAVSPQWDELSKTPAFFDLGAKLSYDFRLFNKTTLQVFAGVNNIFNAFQKDYDFGPDRDSGYIYGPTMPASGYMGLRFTF